jgi:LemA protein
MKAIHILLALVVVLIGIVCLGGGCAIQGYNHAIQLNQAVKRQWADVDVQLERRFDLIPNLVETAKGAGLQEQKVYLGIAEARKSYGGAKTVADKVDSATQVESALSRLLVVMENYPQLRSNEAYQKLQDSLEGTENRIAVARGRYNQAVETLNNFILGFPGAIYGSLAGVHEAKPFEVAPEAKEAPKVDFSDKPAKAEAMPAEAEPKAGQQ